MGRNPNVRLYPKVLHSRFPWFLWGTTHMYGGGPKMAAPWPLIDGPKSRQNPWGSTGTPRGLHIGARAAQSQVRRKYTCPQMPHACSSHANLTQMSTRISAKMYACFRIEAPHFCLRIAPPHFCFHIAPPHFCYPHCTAAFLLSALHRRIFAIRISPTLHFPAPHLARLCTHFARMLHAFAP